MTPLEEQVEKLARELNLEAGRQRGWTDVDDWEYITEQERGGWRNMAKTAIAALLPLEVTDGEARTKPYRCADCDQPHGPFNNIGSGQSNKPEVTYRLVCDRCWGPKPAALTQKGDNE